MYGVPILFGFINFEETVAVVLYAAISISVYLLDVADLLTIFRDAFLWDSLLWFVGRGER